MRRRARLSGYKRDPARNYAVSCIPLDTANGQPEWKGMTMAKVTIELPDDAFATLHRSPKELSQEIRLAAAMIWYTQGRISHEKAAEFSGVSRITFIDALAAAKLPAFHVDVDELMEEVERARDTIREHVSSGVPGSGKLARILREGALEVVVPEPVIQEIHAHGPEDPTVRGIHGVDWLRIVPTADVAPVVALWDLGAGESAVLSHALAKSDSWAVIDDWQAQRLRPLPGNSVHRHPRARSLGQADRPNSGCAACR